MDLPGVRAELEAVRAQPAPAERRRPCAGRSGRRRRPPHHSVDEPHPRGRQGENRPNGLRGDLSERYVRRIAMLRLSERDYGGTIERIQLRSATSAVAPPPWSTEKISTRPVYRVLPWWTVTPDDLPEHAAEQSRDAARAEANQ
nr:DUF5819 family protein [Streptomyces sp. MBT72]